MIYPGIASFGRIIGGNGFVKVPGERERPWGRNYATFWKSEAETLEKPGKTNPKWKKM
jgi:hypothetical protein